jgi:RND family efflux transporter MFP subunit
MNGSLTRCQPKGESSNLGVISLYLTGLLVLFAGCRHRTQVPQLGEVDRLPRLETIKADKGLLVIRHSYTATVDAYEKADLMGQVRGVIKSLGENADIGRPVKEGELLITLDIPDLVAERDHKKALLEQAQNLRDEATHARQVAFQDVKEAQAQEKRYQADAKYREMQHTRVAKLAQGDTVTKQLAEEAELQHASAVAAWKAAQEQILSKQARLQAADIELKVADSRIKVARAEFDKAEALVSFGAIRAPFDGVVTRRWVDRGATVKDPGMRLLTVMRTDKVRVIIDVPERDVPYLRAGTATGSKSVPGNPATLQIPTLSALYPNLVFKGNVTLHAAALDPVTRTMRTEIHLPNTEGYLKPQMTGTATVVLAERKAMTIPSTALVRIGDNIEVYYVDNPTGDPPRGIVKSKKVKLGMDDGLRVEVLPPGLNGDERIIRKGAGLVRVGDRAIPVDFVQPDEALEDS